MYNLLGLVGIRVLPIVFHDEVTVVYISIPNSRNFRR